MLITGHKALLIYATSYLIQRNGSYLLLVYITSPQYHKVIEATPPT